MLNDPIADMLTQIRNAAHAGHETVSVPHSKLNEEIIRLLSKEGFLSDVEVAGEGIRKRIVVAIKYASPRKPVFTSLDRASKPGRRVYMSHKELKPMRQGVGLAILSTPKGVMTDSEARASGVGGEVLCTVW